jgi:acyl-CoA thioesterase YciA
MEIGWGECGDAGVRSGAATAACRLGTLLFVARPGWALSRTIPDLSIVAEAGWRRFSWVGPPWVARWPRGTCRTVVVKYPPAGRADRANTFLNGAPMTDILQLPQKHCALRVVPQPSDANVHGDVFGGWIMAQVDIAGSIPASRRANGRVATIAVNSFVFKQPVFVGDLLSFYADIVKTGNTSVTVAVEVYAQRMSLTEDLVKVTEATLTYVATDSDRRPRALPLLD